MWKNEKFTVTEKKFRQINSLVTSSVRDCVSMWFSAIQGVTRIKYFALLDISYKFAKIILHFKLKYLIDHQYIQKIELCEVYIWRFSNLALFLAILTKKNVFWTSKLKN